MADVDCPRCGAKMPTGGVCPVCETPHSVSMASGTTDHDMAPASPLARMWRSGQLPVGMAAACFLVATVLPLMSNVALREGSNVRLDASVRPIDIAMGTFRMGGRMTAWLLPGTAIFLLQMLYSRRTGSAMTATRPLLPVLALGPLVSVAMPFMILRKHNLSPTPGAALALVLVGSVLCVIATMRFGEGVPEATARKRPRDDDEE